MGGVSRRDLAGGVIDRFRSMGVSARALIHGHVLASVVRNSPHRSMLPPHNSRFMNYSDLNLRSSLRRQIWPSPVFVA